MTPPLFHPTLGCSRCNRLPLLGSAQAEAYCYLAMKCMCHDTICLLMAVGHSLLQARPPGTPGSRCIGGLWATKSEGIGLIVRSIIFQDLQPTVRGHSPPTSRSSSSIDSKLLCTRPISRSLSLVLALAHGLHSSPGYWLHSSPGYNIHTPHL